MTRWTYLPSRRKHHTRESAATKLAGDWWRWLEQHGIDPMVVLAESLVVADDEARTVTYTHINRDMTLPPTRERTVQLEAPPMPFPGGQPA